MSDPVYIQSKAGSNTAAASPATTFTSAVTAGSVVAVLVYGTTATTGASSLADNKTGNTYAKVESHALSVDGDNVELWWAYITNGGASFQVTATLTGHASPTARMDLLELGPCDPSPLDVHNNGYNASSASLDSGNITTSAAVKTVAVGVYGTDSGVGGPGLTPGTNWTVRFEADFRGAITRDAIPISTTTSANGTVGSPMEWAMLVASFKAVASGGTRGLFRTPAVTGLGGGGSFFRDPLQREAQ